MPISLEDDLQAAMGRWLRSHRTHRNQCNEDSGDALFEAEAILLFHFSANVTLPDDLLFPMFKLFVLTLKATDCTADRPDSFLPYIRFREVSHAKYPDNSDR